MSKATYEKFNYSLRPAKNIERKMLSEALARMHRLQSLNRYKYIGFGALSFVDFSLFHKRLGIWDLTSIEAREEDRERFEFNKPLHHINMKWGLSSVVLPEIDLEKKRSIVWLDYDSHLDKDIISDLKNIIARVRSGSIIIITVTADPGGGNDPTKGPQQRYERLRSRVGDDQIPIRTRKTDLNKWGLAKVSREIISTNITDTLKDRNGVLPLLCQLSYKQLFNFHYADGCKMLTTGGLITHAKDDQKLGLQQWESLPFIKDGADPYCIETPILTMRETSHLDQMISKNRSLYRDVKWIPKIERDKYKQVYRYSPTYIEAEI